jgi:hypothetical protein
MKVGNVLVYIISESLGRPDVISSQLSAATLLFLWRVRNKRVQFSVCLYEHNIHHID